MEEWKNLSTDAHLVSAKHVTRADDSHGNDGEARLDREDKPALLKVLHHPVAAPRPLGEYKHASWKLSQGVFASAQCDEKWGV
jgi:hypothetical protein